MHEPKTRQSQTMIEIKQRFLSCKQKRLGAGAPNGSQISKPNKLAGEDLKLACGLAQSIGPTNRKCMHFAEKAGDFIR